MSGITAAINTALSGLELFEAGIGVVSNNLANESTSGYAVESIDPATATSVAGQPGNGVQAAQIRRAANGFAVAQLRGANSANQAAGSLATQLTSISNALTNNGDVQTALNQFFDDINTLAANPASAAQRQTVLADAQNVGSAFESAAGFLGSAISGSSQNLQQSVASANSLISQLETINKALALTPNDPSLLDQQQAALNSLSSDLPVNAIPQPNGSILLTSGGTVLLDQGGAQALSIMPGPNGAAPMVTAGSGAATVSLGEADGAMGSAIASWQAGSAALQGLNVMASIVAGAANTAQAEGLTPSGVSGGPIFVVPPPSAMPGATNTGGASVTAQITSPSALPMDGGKLLLAYSSANGWSGTDALSGQSYTASGTPPVIAGLTLNVTGSPADGDQFTLNPAPDAASGISVATASPDAIAAADPYVGTPGILQSDGAIRNDNGGTINTGTDSVTPTPASGAAVIPASYFGQNLQITFNAGTSYTVATSANPGTAIASGMLGAAGGNIAIAYPAGAAGGQYWQLPISGTPDAGDVLTLTPGGSSSGSNASRMAALWSAPGITASGTLQQAIIGFGTGLGANAQQATQLSTATAAQVSTATTNLQNISGVDTDQQAVTLTNYQQAYQAAAQAISAAHTMFESLLTAV
jgi:flagellar hook-associated protein 1 FlgK